MTKMVSLSDDAYLALKSLKQPGESFSDVVLEVTREQRKGILSFAGKWHGSRSEIDRIFTSVLAGRKRSKPREIGF